MTRYTNYLARCIQVFFQIVDGQCIGPALEQVFFKWELICFYVELLAVRFQKLVRQLVDMLLDISKRVC